jgi:aminocarboxymuconate-semialdehyde decarboxylase
VRIDVHAHLLPLGLPDLAESTGDPRWPTVVVDGEQGRIVARGTVFRAVDDGYWSVARRLEQLDAWGVDLQVLSPLPVLVPTWSAGRHTADWCRAVNDSMADAVAAGGPRFLGLGILPTHDVDAAVAELDHVRALGLVGIELGTAVEGSRSLADRSADELLTYLATEDVAVLLHPVRRGLLGDLPGILAAAVDPTTDTTLALLSRLWSDGGVAMPRSCVVHGGGTVPWVWPRLRTLSGRTHAPIPPWFHVDTAAVDRGQLEYLVGALGVERVMLGTDCPAAPGPAVEDHLAVLGRLGHVGEAILSGNAARFLGLG